MNCKPGDLAIIINDPFCDQVDLGRIVEVVCQDPEEFHEWECRAFAGCPLKFALDGIDATPGCVSIPDAWLRPIRDQPGEDQTLSWKEVPKPLVHAPASK